LSQGKHWQGTKQKALHLFTLERIKRLAHHRALQQRLVEKIKKTFDT
jgi:hypothetical protein